MFPHFFFDSKFHFRNILAFYYYFFLIWKPGDNIGQVFYATGFIIGRSGLRVHNIFRSWQG